MPDRLICLVPFCCHARGARKGDPLPRPLQSHEWICGAHWRLVPWQTRRLLFRARRRNRRAAADRLWRRCTRQAIEAAAGIAS